MTRERLTVPEAIAAGRSAQRYDDLKQTRATAVSAELHVKITAGSCTLSLDGNDVAAVLALLMEREATFMAPLGIDLG